MSSEQNGMLPSPISQRSSSGTATPVALHHRQGWDSNIGGCFLSEERSAVATRSSSNALASTPLGHSRRHSFLGVSPAPDNDLGTTASHVESNVSHQSLLATTNPSAMSTRSASRATTAAVDVPTTVSAVLSSDIKSYFRLMGVQTLESLLVAGSLALSHHTTIAPEKADPPSTEHERNSLWSSINEQTTQSIESFELETLSITRVVDRRVCFAFLGHCGISGENVGDLFTKFSKSRSILHDVREAIRILRLDDTTTTLSQGNQMQKDENKQLVATTVALLRLLALRTWFLQHTVMKTIVQDRFLGSIGTTLSGAHTIDDYLSAEMMLESNDVLDSIDCYSNAGRRVLGSLKRLATTNVTTLITNALRNDAPEDDVASSVSCRATKPRSSSMLDMNNRLGILDEQRSPSTATSTSTSNTFNRERKNDLNIGAAATRASMDIIAESGGSFLFPGMRATRILPSFHHPTTSNEERLLHLAKDTLDDAIAGRLLQLAAANSSATDTKYAEKKLAFTHNAVTMCVLRDVCNRSAAARFQLLMNSSSNGSRHNSVAVDDFMTNMPSLLMVQDQEGSLPLSSATTPSGPQDHVPRLLFVIGQAAVHTWALLSEDEKHDDDESGNIKDGESSLHSYRLMLEIFLEGEVAGLQFNNNASSQAPFDSHPRLDSIFERAVAFLELEADPSDDDVQQDDIATRLIDDPVAAAVPASRRHESNSPLVIAVADAVMLWASTVGLVSLLDTLSESSSEKKQASENAVDSAAPQWSKSHSVKLVVHTLLHAVGLQEDLASATTHAMTEDSPHIAAEQASIAVRKRSVWNGDCGARFLRRIETATDNAEPKREEAQPVERNKPQPPKKQGWCEDSLAALVVLISTQLQEHGRIKRAMVGDDVAVAPPPSAAVAAPNGSGRSQGGANKVSTAPPPSSARTTLQQQQELGEAPLLSLDDMRYEIEMFRRMVNN